VNKLHAFDLPHDQQSFSLVFADKAPFRDIFFMEQVRFFIAIIIGHLLTLACVVLWFLFGVA